MHVMRENKVEVFVSARELLEALKLLRPEEFMLNQFPADMQRVTLATNSDGLLMTYIRKPTGPAEIDYNRMQRGALDAPG